MCIRCFHFSSINKQKLTCAVVLLRYHGHYYVTWAYLSWVMLHWHLPVDSYVIFGL